MDQQKASTTEVESAIKAFFKAWNDRDFQGATAPFSPDAIVFDPDKIEGTEAIKAWATSIFEGSKEFSVTIDKLHVQTEGQVAWATAHWVFERVDAGSTNDGYWSMVWLREEANAYSLKLFHISHLNEDEAN